MDETRRDCRIINANNGLSDIYCRAIYAILPMLPILGLLIINMHVSNKQVLTLAALLLHGIHYKVNHPISSAQNCNCQNEFWPIGICLSIDTASPSLLSIMRRDAYERIK